MARQQLQALVALAECTPALRRHLRWQGSWQAWLNRVRALGFSVTAADLQQACVEERQVTFLGQSRVPPIRPLH
jgi:hypothetical protein